MRVLADGFGLGFQVGCWTWHCWVQVAADGAARWSWTVSHLLDSTALGAMLCGWSIVLGAGRNLGSGFRCGL